MLSHKDNELMCRVGPETPMGKALRRFWTPALQISDLPDAGGDPRRVELLGQAFVAFRTPEGEVGFLDEGCCHRGVSLALGRVENCGIRCLFHGWKFAPDGTLLETPNVSDERFRQRVRARAYPVREAGGLIWVYIGPKELEPPFPHYDWFDLHPDHRLNAYLVENSNFVQVIEALVDSSHLNTLHADGLKATTESDLEYAKDNRPLMADGAPRVEAEDTEFGFQYAALRTTGPGTVEARITAFISPYAVQNPIGNLWMAVVPASDTRSVYYHVFWDDERKIGIDPLRQEQLEFVGLDDKALADFGMNWATIDSPDKPSVRNGFLQDRAAMARGETFSGFHSFSQEDAAVTMSAGAIKDRRFENLCPADMAIVRLYKTMLDLAKAGDSGADPVGVDVNPRAVQGTQGVVPPEGWQALVPMNRTRRKKADRVAAGQAA